MLTVTQPELYAYLAKNFFGGLFPFKLLKENTLGLVIKAPKEMLLAAKIRKQFKIHVIPITDNGFSLISSFYDTEEDPLIIKTPLFLEDEPYLFKEILSAENLEVYFFDENNCEYFAYSARAEIANNIKEFISSSKFSRFNFETAKKIIDEMQIWYIARTKKQDSEAVTIHLKEPLYSDDIVIIDARPSSLKYVSDSEISENRLERLEPGAYQERDIALIFSRIFPSHQIYLNPMNCDDGEEIVDIMIIGKERVLFVQAKDSPNTERILKNTVTRKKATTAKHLTKALGQLEGAIKRAFKSKKLDFIIGKRQFSVSIKKEKLFGLVVMRELFLDEYDKYTDETLKLCDSTGIPIILLEYNELHTYTMHLTDEENYFRAYDKVFSEGSKNRNFPRLRFGLTAG